MPGLPLVVHETTNLGCNCSHSRTVEEMCHQDSRHLSVEEEAAAEESLTIYCKPVELYNILQRRALQNPSFLQRCLHYKIQANPKKRLRNGSVVFNYRYYNNTLHKTEVLLDEGFCCWKIDINTCKETVTEDFSCPFCLVQCASFKGLSYHLNSSHDLFNYEFWVTEEHQTVNVSVKTDIWRSEIVADGVDPRLQTFSFCLKPRRRRALQNAVHNAKNVYPLAMNRDSPEVSREASHEGHLDAGTNSSCKPISTSLKDAKPSNKFFLQRVEKDGPNKEKETKVSKAFSSENCLKSERHKNGCRGLDNPCTAELAEPIASSSNIAGFCSATARASASNECLQSISGNNVAQVTKIRKLSAERADPRNRALLQKRQFFHSHRAQPMALDEVLSDRDSEDEVDDDITDLEEQRLLDDFVDVTKDEKQIMRLWNSFVRKQRVLADGHIPWACESFSKLHGRDLVQAPALIWGWRLFMIKLWNHSLLDARTMDNCNLILDSYRNESSDNMHS